MDALLVYLPRVDRVCFFPQEVSCGKSGLNTRLEPPRNGQSEGCVLAGKFFW